MTHTQRRQGNRSIPGNQLDRNTPPYAITPPILDLVAQIVEAIGRADQAGIWANPRLQRANRIRAIQGSLAIEGNRLSEEQISAILNGKHVIAPLREIQEVRSALKAYEEYPRWEPASEADLLTAHGVLMAGLLDAPGSYRRGGVAVVGGGEIHHIGPSANRVPLLMSNLLRWLAETKEHSLIASSIFHYEFEFIHPFADGNGRMGRLWQTLILTHWNPLFAYVPVESHVHARQSKYYEAIQQSTAEGTSTPFIIYMLKAILDAVVSTLQESHQETPSGADSGSIDSRRN
ncbi:MAG: Fic family protein [Gammaproteobacteria bacterium]|nr:Fic family protein [Gammaproteobacteria bacterium]MYC59274.1 Fic family protein [Gammaproteobacteria bacterium]MYH85126.1 Fic family protein [Gammaproteobacteria bacterium]MYK05578.1 Fic family protein [Gammaproteobacteria bacterium]